jgi:predicted dehydrogenase
MKTYRWGIIGLGKIAHKFAQDLQTLENAELWAVASTSQKRADDFAAQYKVKNAFGSYEDIVNCPDIDIIYIATPHTGHHAATLLCLKKQIPVLCEKPFGINSNQVAEMIQCAKENDTFLMEALWTRFLPNTLKLLSLLEANTIGNIVEIQADFGFKAQFDPKSRLFDKKLAGGALLDIGIYPLFLSLLLLGEPDEIEAKSIIGASDVDESTSMILTYKKNKQVANLHCTLRATTPTEAIIYGEKGYLKMYSRFHEPNPGIDLFLYKNKEKHFFPSENVACIGYAYEAIEVMKCLHDGKKESDILSLSFSTKLIKLLDDVAKKTLLSS